MPRKPKPQPDNPEQFKRFIELTREVEVAGGDLKQFDRILDKLASKPRERVIKKTPRYRHSRESGG